MVYVVKFRLANGTKHEVIGEDIRSLMDRMREMMDAKCSPVVDIDIRVRPPAMQIGEQ